MPSRSTSKAHERQAHGLAQLLRDWEAVRGYPTEGAFLLAAFGGCRVGESLGVKPEEVTLVESHGVPVTVCEIVGQIGTLGEVKERAKNPQSARPVCVPGPMGVRLKELADACE